MKKITVLFIMLISMAGLTASVSANANTPNTSSENISFAGTKINHATMEISFENSFDSFVRH